MIAPTDSTSEITRSDAGDLGHVHMALNIVEDKDSSQLDSFLRFPISDMDSSTSSSLPTLDQVSVCSEEDDDSSLSSTCSADERGSLEKGRRSIFSQYWEKVGGAPSIQRALFTEESVKPENKPTDKTHEKGDSETHSFPASDKSRRRNIFKKTCWSESLPALTFPSNSPERKLRKIQSGSVLQRRKPKPKQSCLRQGRFSSDQLLLEESESSSNSSVQFNLHADVKVFTPPVEIYATIGWSTWFA
jgi:hypothetical protein